MAEGAGRRRAAGTVIRLLLTLASVAYPLLWYWGHRHGGFAMLALLMAAVWLARAIWASQGWQRLMAVTMAAFFVLVCLLQQPEAMYWYPVAVNALMLLLFGGSLWSRQSLIERLARLQDPHLPPEGVRYTRRITRLWCGFFVFNGGLTIWLIALQAWQAWAWYTGVVSYVLMGLLLGGEWLYRHFVLRLPQRAE